jgi:conjugal transfer pilus assembly protein TraW
VDGITRTVKTRSWKVDPSIVLDHDVATPDGKLIAAAGTRVNPLAYISLSKTLIFYNGDDETQVTWAVAQDKKLKGRDKLVLINGSVLAQERQFKKPIYFDQGGKLISRFGIKHVPALVSQAGLALHVSEVTP